MIITIFRLLIAFGTVLAVYFLGYLKGHEHGWDEGWDDCADFSNSKYGRRCIDCPFYKAARIWLDEFEWSYGEHEKRVNKEKGSIDFDLLSRDLNKEIELMEFTEDYEYDDSYRY